MRTVSRFAILSLLLAICSVGFAARVVLHGGAEVIGDVLLENDDVVVVDIGIDVLRLDRADVEFIADDQQEEADKEKDQPEETIVADNSEAWQLYRTAELNIDSIENNADRFGEAVVMVRSPGGLGSGFIISEDGYLITNYHVIARETEIRVVVYRRTDSGFEQEHHRSVRIVALNPFVDLALLKIEDAEREFEHVYLGEMAAVEVGQEVFAIGNPLGLTRTVSQGIVSTSNRNFEGRLYIQTTTDINPGNSGGPLFNNRGQVIGVTSMGYIYLGGLNFAIPVDVVKRFIDNRDAFAYDQTNPNSGYRYLQPAGRQNHDMPSEHDTAQ